MTETLDAQDTLPVPPVLGSDMKCSPECLIWECLNTAMFPLVNGPNSKFCLTYILSENLSATTYSRVRVFYFTFYTT